jgi:hypothetical protein
LDEFEDEGYALEEFLLSLNDYQDVVKAKAEKWREMISSFSDSISQSEEVIAALKDNVSSKVEFWELVKLSKPSVQLTALI